MGAILTMKNSIRTYSELHKLKTFDERFRYLCINGIVGETIFGGHRVLNQRFYSSREWRMARDYVIFRDCGCDLGIPGRDIFGRIVIHHLNPITISDLEKGSDFLTNPEYLITTTHETHNAIHYGDESLLMLEPIRRLPNDTCPWKML